MGDISGLIETVKDMKLEQNTDMINRLQQGVFTLKDMRDQLQMIMGMGPLSRVMSMMPGLPSELVQMGDKEGTMTMKRFMCMFDSMTTMELESDGKLFKEQPTRITRVSKGSGTQYKEVEMLLLQCTKFAEMVKKIGGAKGLLKKQSGNPGRRGNPNQMQQLQNSLQSMMPAGMLEQMGGMGGIQDMMQQFTQGGGLGNLASMFGGAAPGMFGGAAPSRGRGGRGRR